MTSGNPGLEAMALRSQIMAETDAAMVQFAQDVGVICRECVLPPGVITRAEYIRPGCKGPVEPQTPGHPAREYTGKRCPVFQHPITGEINFCLPPDNRGKGVKQ